MRARFSRFVPSVALLGLAACSPAAPPPETPKPPPPKAVAPPPKVDTHATWSFPSAYGVAHAQLDLGAKGVLQVGQRGRRWLFGKTGGDPKQAPTLAPQDLVDARMDGDKILLLGEEGEVFTVSDPIGPIEAMKPGPKDQKALAFRAGKSALLGLEKDGTLHRSTDNGASWNTSKIPLRPGDVAVSMAANQKGEALVLIHPQRLLLSTDDGASFKPIESPGIGALSIRRDASGELFLIGAEYDKLAKLSSGKLEVGGSPVAFLERSSKDAPAPKKGFHVTRRYLAGDRLVTVTDINESGSTKKIVAGVSALGSEPTTPSVLEAAASKYGTRVFVAGHESTVVVAIHDDQVDPPSTKFLRTTDDGKNWEPAGTLSGKIGWSFPLFVGPSWIVVGEVCDEETKTCKAGEAKVGSAEWQELPLHEKSAIHAVEFDTARDRAWILAWENDAPLLITSKLKEVAFNVSGVELPRSTPRAATIDDKGWLRLAYPYPSRIVRVAPDLGVHPALYLPFQAYEMDLAGDRGFAYDANDAWETSDGGEKWLKVAPGTSGDVRCTKSGCVQGGVVRLGWDLPSDKATLVASATQAPAKKKEASAPPSSAPIAPLRLACTPTGAWKPYDASYSGAQLALDGDVRFTMPAGSKDGAVDLLVARGAAQPTKVSVLGADPKRKPADPVRDRHWSQRSGEGFVAVRYSFSTEAKMDGGSKYQPVDVELGWYSAASGKVAKAKIDKVSAFRVGLSSQSALHSIVEGGLLFLPGNGDAPLYFVKENGKVETMPRPPTADGAVYGDAVKLGNKIVLASLRFGDITMAMTSDAGKTWTKKTWSLGIPTTLGAVDGKMVLIGGQSLWSTTTAPTALFAFDTLTNDPPDATRIDPSKLQVGASALEACTAKTRAGLRTELGQSKDRRSVMIAITPDKKDKDANASMMSMVHQVDRIDSAGNACVDSISAESSQSGSQYAIVSPHDLAKGTLVRRPAGAWSKIEARTLTCKLQ